MSARDPYLHPKIDILQNKLGIIDPTKLDRAERLLTLQRMSEGVPTGGFDLAHLQAIHRHLFQDIFDWAGEIRTLEISKGGNQFQFRQYIETGMNDVHGRLVKSNFLRGLDSEKFANGAGAIMGDINYVHPFREGNGRTQLMYLKQLGCQAGHNIKLDKLDAEAWLYASKAAHNADYAPMSAEIARVIEPRRERDASRRPIRIVPKDRQRERDDERER